jgi:hypothetical protein
LPQEGRENFADANPNPAEAREGVTKAIAKLINAMRMDDMAFFLRCAIKCDGGIPGLAADQMPASMTGRFRVLYEVLHREPSSPAKAGEPVSRDGLIGNLSRDAC